MTHSWSIRIYKEGDELGILELMKLSGVKRTTEQWFWEYKNNPFGHHIGVAEHNGQIVGHMALIPTYVKVGEKTVMGSQAVDLLVHPKFRRQGMFLALGKMLTSEAGKKEIDITYGFPNAPAHSGHLKYDWFDVCKVHELIKPINMNKMVDLLDQHRIPRFLSRYKISRDIIKPILQIILPIISFFSRIFNRIENNYNLRNAKICTIESFDDRIDDFWKKVSNYYPIIAVRNKKYLNWRYFEKPNVKYTVLLAEKNEEILGYIVLRFTIQKNLRLGYIVDILALPDKKAVVQSLIAKAVDHFIAENVDSIYCWMLDNNSTTHTYYKILRYNGFIPVSSNILIARVNTSQISKESVEDFTKWYIALGDSDHI